jgi:putative DNA primase/helicase
MMMRAAEIAISIGTRWPAILEQLGIAPEFLVNRHGPCPACGGSDRYRFDNKGGRGGYYCNQCGAGDGFKLLQRVHGWDFRTARDRVMEAAGLTELILPSGGKNKADAVFTSQRWEVEKTPIAQPPQRVLRLRRETCALHDCDDAVAYLESRSLWPAAAESTLRAHVGVDYFQDGQKVGRYSALIADVRDFDGELVTLHVTYLDNGRKLGGSEPRKILSPLHSREACAVRLYAITGDSMGIGEGLETCIAASALHEMPVWSALNTSLLAKFTPPPQIQRLVVFLDRDVAGLTAAAQLFERLQGKVHLELKTPPAPANDWAEVLEQRCR